MLGSPTTLSPSLQHHVLRLLAVALPVLALVAGAFVTPADAAAAPTLTLTGPADAARDTSVTLRATLAAGAATANQTVRLERDGTTVDTRQTGADGTVEFTVTLVASATFRAVRDGSGTGDTATVASPERTVRAFDAATALSIDAPGTGYVDSRSTITTTLTLQGTGTPVVGEKVALQRRVDGAWQHAQTVTTSATGVATYSVEVRPTDNTFRTAYAGRYDSDQSTDDLRGTTSDPVTIAPRRRTTELRLSGPARVVDEEAATLRMTWRAGNGDPVPGSVVVQRRVGDAWRKHATVRLGADGVGTLQVRPRTDSRWRAVGAAGRWWLADTSGVKAIDNVPPGTPVAYPEGAPRPAVRLPRNARAKGAGANATISRISDSTWRSMVGRSWHRGCPVGRSQLRVVRVNYWGYDGYRYRGEIVLRDSVAHKGARVLSAVYRNRLPIYRMYRVDRFGWSAKLGGANDYRSMRAGNTSAFNCRGVVGNPGVRSPHSYGRAIDINPWENPYRSRQGLVPNSWWQSRTHPRIAWRSRSHPMVRTMAANGFRWTYGTGDNHHFDG